MITLPGQLAIKTIHGRNGPFNVGRLTTCIGEFVTKDVALEQFSEGKYEGEFIITKIYSKSWATGSHIGIDTRADLGGMSLSNLDPLTKAESQRLSPQVVDPLDEDATPLQPVASVPSDTVPDTPTLHALDPLIDTTPFGEERIEEVSAEQPCPDEADAALFGAIWPLGQVVKLDATVDRRLFKQQAARLGELDYGFDHKSQEWSVKTAA